MQIFTSPQRDNHARTHHSVFYRPDVFPATQPTASKHWRLLVSKLQTFTRLKRCICIIYMHVKEWRQHCMLLRSWDRYCRSLFYLIVIELSLWKQQHALGPVATSLCLEVHSVFLAAFYIVNQVPIGIDLWTTYFATSGCMISRLLAKCGSIGGTWLLGWPHPNTVHKTRTCFWW